MAAHPHRHGTHGPIPDRRKVGRWYLGEILGKGGYSWVKKGYDRKTGNAVALKFMDKKGLEPSFEKQIKQVRTEIEALKQLRHPNVMRLLAYNLNATYPDRSDAERNVILLVLEYMPGGELFDILYYTSALEEKITRFYFHQLIEGLEACHNACIVHRDIKPQNLLLDSHFRLKITDFGLAKLIESDSDAVMETFHVGTRGYQAPEVLAKRPYTSACDVFSSGVVLFILSTGYPPFEHAKASDKWYGPIARREVRKFWKQHKGCGVSSPAAIDLISRMLTYNPDERITIAQIKQHPWYNGPVPTQEEVFRTLRSRHAQMEVKRRNDPVKQDILQGSLKKRDGRRDPILDLVAPTFPPYDTVGLLDTFTDIQCGPVLLAIRDLIIGGMQGTCTPVDMTECSFQARVCLASRPIINLAVQVYYYEEYECNLVRFTRIGGDGSEFPKVLRHIVGRSSHVLTGLKSEKLEDFTEARPKAGGNKELDGIFEGAGALADMSWTDDV